MNKRLWIWLLFFFLPMPVHAQDYLLGPSDVIKISVFRQDDLSLTVRVDGEGMIVYPLLGQIKAAGLSVSQLGEKISALLADGYIKKPQVSVFVQEFRGKKATILGNIKEPGLYELQGYTTLLELISKAGGLTKEAGGQAVIKRGVNTNIGGVEHVLTVDLRRLVEQGDTSENVEVKDGDSVFINKAGIFFVTGEVKKPDAYKIEPGTSVIKAVTIAGGFTDRASRGGVNIIRQAEGKEVVLTKVTMDELVMPDDVIVVPETFF